MQKILKKDLSQTRVVKSVCNMCTNHCGINVYVQDGKVVNVDGMPEHPLNRLCIRPSSLGSYHIIWIVFSGFTVLAIMLVLRIKK